MVHKVSVILTLSIPSICFYLQESGRTTNDEIGPVADQIFEI